MKKLILCCSVVVVGLFLFVGRSDAQSQDPDKSKDKPKGPASKQAPRRGTNTPPAGAKSPSGSTPGQYGHPAGGATGAPGSSAPRATDASGRSTDSSTHATTGSTPQGAGATGASGAGANRPGQTGAGGGSPAASQGGATTPRPGGNPTTATTHAPAPAPSTHAPAPAPTTTVPTANGGYQRQTASGRVTEKMETKPDGSTHVQHVNPAGRVQTEVVTKPNGVQQTTHYAPDGKVRQQIVVNHDGTKETTKIQYGRGGQERVTETVHVDPRGREVSKTVVVKHTTVIINHTTIVNDRVIERHYDRARFGFVYRPMYVGRAPVFVSWYNPYWYTPAGVLVVHPFHYSWGWDDAGWYRYHRHYWATYEVYPAPSYWVTDWLIAGYVADRYESSVSAAQALEEARVAREDAERARLAAQAARQDAEIAEARAAQADAEARAAKAEAYAQKAQAREAQAGQPHPNATPIDPATKEALRSQIESAVAEKKAIAEQAANGNVVIPDLSKALADPKHVYPVSAATSVTKAVDQSPAGTLSEGDLLKLEPGQDAILKDANENTFVTMRVLSSKGEDGEVPAGTLIGISLKTLQDFDSEFRAKLDLGLAEADKNQDQFRSGAVATN